MVLEEPVTFGAYENGSSGIPIPLTMPVLLDVMEKAMKELRNPASKRDYGKTTRQHYAIRKRILQMDAEKDFLLAFERNAVEVLSQRIAELEERDMFLQCLEEAGVDNWDGYSEAHRILAEWKEELSDAESTR